MATDFEADQVVSVGDVRSLEKVVHTGGVRAGRPARGKR